MLQLAQRVGQLGRALRHTLLQRLVERLQGRLRAMLVGDVEAVDEQALDRAVRVEDGLVDEVDEALFQRRRGRALQLNLHVGADERGRRVEAVVQQLEEALALDFGQRLAHGQARDLAMADQLQVGLVGELEAMLAARQQRHEAGRLLEQPLHAVALLRAQRHLAGELAVGLGQRVGRGLAQRGGLGQGLRTPAFGVEDARAGQARRELARQQSQI